MPWNKTEPMNERIKFIARYLESAESFSELCEDFKISRKTGYKWVDRYEKAGINALADCSRSPHSHPHAVSRELVSKILEIRQKHLRWGPKKLRIVLARQNPGLLLPAHSTIGEVLKRHGLIKPRKRRRISSPYTDRLREYASPNAVWCADFKGHFPVDGERCHPLTITDGYSRYLIRCTALPHPLFEDSKRVFESAFKQYGLPETIRTDNGAPFSTLAPGGLSRLSVWWIKLGIRPERIMPGRPEQNGRHERMHGTLKAETAKPPRSSMRAQQRAFDDFKQEYNHERPHEALNQTVPASLYIPSPREFPTKLPEPDYPDHFKVLRAYPNGVISFDHSQWIISGCLKGELVGLEEVDEDRWKVYFGPIALGILDVRNAKSRRGRCFGKMVRIDGENPKRGRPRHA